MVRKEYYIAPVGFFGGWTLELEGHLISRYASQMSASRAAAELARSDEARGHRARVSIAGPDGRLRALALQ